MGRGRPVSSIMETLRPRGAHENRIFKSVAHDLFKLTAADENGGLRGVWEPISERRLV